MTITFTAIISTGCVGSWVRVKPLEDYDFSVDNIVEVRFSSSPMYTSLHGTIYGVKKGDSQEGDEAITAIASAWTTLKRNASYRKAKKLNLLMATGGTYYYECIFSDGSSIKLSEDSKRNLRFNDGSSVRITDEFKLFELFKAYEQIIIKENIIGHISQSHDENCDCDDKDKIYN